MNKQTLSFVLTTLSMLGCQRSQEYLNYPDIITPTFTTSMNADRTVAWEVAARRYKSFGDVIRLDSIGALNGRKEWKVTISKSVEWRERKQKIQVEIELKNAEKLDEAEGP